MAAQHQEVRLGVGPVGRLLQRLADGRLQPVDVVRHIAEVADAPAVGLEALLDVVVVGQLGRPVDGDVVVVVEGDEAAEAEVAGQRGRLVGDALHEAAVAGDHVGVVVAHVGTEAVAHHTLGDGQADRVAETLAQRPRGHLDARRVAALGVARRLAAPLAELAQVLEREVVPGQVQEGVLEDARVAVGENETVTVGPVGIARVVVHDAGPQHVGERGQRHGCTRVSGLGRLGRVHGDATDDVDSQLDERRILDNRGRGVQRHEPP